VSCGMKADHLEKGFWIRNASIKKRPRSHLGLGDAAAFGAPGGAGSDGGAATVDVVRHLLMLDWISKRDASGLKKGNGENKRFSS